MKWAELTCSCKCGAKPLRFRCSTPAWNSICGTIDDAAKRATGTAVEALVDEDWVMSAREKPLDDVHSEHDARGVGDQAGGHGVAGLLDPGRAEVDGDHVER